MTNKELGELAQSLFVQFCKQERIPQRRIPKEEGKKTADYMILLGGQEVVVEVKGINESEGTRRAREIQERTGKPEAFGSKPGARVYQRVTDSYAQIKSSSEGKRAGLLILYGHDLAHFDADPGHIRIALFGIDTVTIHVPKDPRQKPWFGNRFQGGGKGVTPDMKRALSGVARLNVQYERPMRLEVLHNPFATIPLDQKAMAFPGLTQYELYRGGNRDWNELRLVTPKDF